MSTKSNKSSGTQHNPRGVTQGVTLVDSRTGNPIDTVEDSNGVKRLAVDANVTANISGIEVSLDGTGSGGDNVYLVDNVTGNKLKINPDGSIDTNIEVDAADGDNIAIADPITGNKIKVEADGSININATLVSPLAKESKQDTQISQATSTNTKLDTLIAKDFATSAKQDTLLTELQAKADLTET